MFADRLGFRPLSAELPTSWAGERRWAGTLPPVEDPIVIFAIAMVVFLGAPLLFRRFHLPGIIGIILFGILLGPGGTGLLERTETFVVLGEVGLVYLMFLAGVELDLDGFHRNRVASGSFGILSFLIPQVVAMVVAMEVLGFTLPTAALFGAIISSHTLLAYPVLTALDIGDNNAVTAAISGTAITDTAALLVLAIVVGAHEGDLGVSFWVELVAGIGGLGFGIFVIAPRIGRWFFAHVHAEQYFQFLFIVAVVFLAAAGAEIVGLKHIIGAFFAGIALCPLVPESSILMDRITFVGNALFIPFFLFSVGLLVAPTAILRGPETVLYAAALIGLVLPTKLLASLMTGWQFGFDRDEQLLIFGLTAGQAAAALAIVLIGYEQLGLFDEAMINAVVLLILVTSLLSPSITQRYGQRIAEREPRPTADHRGPARVLVCIGRSTPGPDRLLELGELVGGADGDQPVALLTVLTHSSAGPGWQPGSRGDQWTDPESPAPTAHLDDRSWGTDRNGVEKRTRVETNPVTGILKTITEDHITCVLVGWPERGVGTRLFGTTVDRLLRRTSVLTLVCRLNAPLKTSERLVCVVPHTALSSPGFVEAVTTIVDIAAGVDIELVWYVHGHERDATEQFEHAIPAASGGKINAVPADRTLSAELRDVVETGDLLVGICPRPGARGWNPGLESFPRTLSGTAAENVVIAAPARRMGEPKPPAIGMR